MNSRQDAKELFRTEGDVSRPGSGWTYQAGSEEEIVYIPFEGYYPNKGGRMQSPWFALPGSGGQGQYCRLTFKARTGQHCYWWLDFLDANDQPVPDCNSKVYPGETRAYDEVIYAPGAACKAQIAFVSKGKVEASDLRFTTATAAEAAEWCDALYSTLPPLKFTAPADAMALLPKTKAALKNGTPWRVVMLGHSIMHDSFNSLYMSLIQRDFPKSRLNVIPSVRGGTLCDYYRQPDQFPKYVTAHKPDLLMILDSLGNDDLEEVIRLTRNQVECEVLVISMPLRADPDRWERNVTPVRECAAKTNVAFWDVTTPCSDYIAAAPGLDYARDFVHNNDVGKQIIGQVLHRHFLTAK